jgi:hypothetical protein
MDVICDTNVWYGIGKGTIDNSKLSADVKLIATYNNIDEFARTKNLIRIPNDTRNAIQSMFKFSSKHAIYQPPLIHLKQLSEPSYSYDIREKLGNMLNFTAQIANGHAIASDQTEEYSSFCDQRKNDLKSVADLFNKQAQQIKPNIKDLKAHRKEDSILLNRELISLFVSKAAGKGLDITFNWTSIELFENVLKVFFNALETGEFVAQPNDWYDLFILLYVQPGMKFWTKEKKWIRFIKEAGMESYLFDDSNL